MLEGPGWTHGSGPARCSWRCGVWCSVCSSDKSKVLVPRTSCIWAIDAPISMPDRLGPTLIYWYDFLPIISCGTRALPSAQPKRARKRCMSFARAGYWYMHMRGGSLRGRFGGHYENGRRRPANETYTIVATANTPTADEKLSPSSCERRPGTAVSSFSCPSADATRAYSERRRGRIA
jgi:hypothetical protein